MSGFQLKDILITCHEFNTIKTAIDETVMSNKKGQNASLADIYVLAEQENIKTKAEQNKVKEAEKMKKCSPSYDIKKLLTETNAKDAIEKLKEHKISKETFWELKDEDLKEVLEIKVFGTRKNLL